MKNTMMKRNVLVILAVVVLAGIAVYQNFATKDRQASANKEAAPKPNYMAPGFKLTALDGNVYEVGGTRDKPLLVNFWASWCGPCELEAPDLKQLYDKYEGKIDFYAVNMTASDRMDNIKSFVKHFEFKFPVLLDSEGKVGELYRISGIPMTYLVDKNGVIKEGFSILHPDELEKRIKQLIES
ncbi:TlpA family protein disulfide reductase [Paenibacillus hemerocallicola]|uniref:TlpA family protein disulfide reductase n=1 Tax=Paenibacillus hemerocallicola TaxID=1172614 RepID=A0A5C4TA42_9BACL|nr:TlpA disulfide reductase family protein [Paenibacillus hemerocallicola]TNJ65765.1 TlpA family protein disulfide reductase [Paenibacillus hemerocallicola]